MEARCLKCGKWEVRHDWSWCVRCRAECSDDELASYILGFAEAVRLVNEDVVKQHLDEVTARDIQRLRARRAARLGVEK